MHAMIPLLKETDFPPLQRKELDTVQINMGYKCNQSCLHCHVNAGPNRSEMMNLETVKQILTFLEKYKIPKLDITGGAPEINQHFRFLVQHAHALGVHIMDRCNLTILEEPGYEDLAAFLAEHKVEVIASLPCYSEENVNQQRGKNVFNKSISAIQTLNRLGYAMPNSELELNLVYNPVGPYLPPPQQTLESDYRRELFEHFSIRFNHLFTITNMPIARFGSTLVSKGEFKRYMKLLKDSYDRSNLKNVMCRSMISVDYNGYLYDCDFNQMLNIPLQYKQPFKTHISEVNQMDLTGKPIAIADHCYGCTAGQGSSCGGALN